MGWFDWVANPIGSIINGFQTNDWTGGKSAANQSQKPEQQSKYEDMTSKAWVDASNNYKNAYDQYNLSLGSMNAEVGKANAEMKKYNGYRTSANTAWTRDAGDDGQDYANKAREWGKVAANETTQRQVAGARAGAAGAARQSGLNAGLAASMGGQQSAGAWNNYDQNLQSGINEYKSGVSDFQDRQARLMGLQQNAAGIYQGNANIHGNQANINQANMGLAVQQQGNALNSQNAIMQNDLSDYQKYLNQQGYETGSLGLGGIPGGNFISSNLGLGSILGSDYDMKDNVQRAPNYSDKLFKILQAHKERSKQ